MFIYKMISIVRRYTVSPDGLSFTDPLDILAPLNASDTRLNQHSHCPTIPK